MTRERSGSPFAALAALADRLPAAPSAGAGRTDATSRPSEGDDDAARAFAGKLTVATSRKGRGGRTVTTVAGLRGSADLLDSLARELRTALGCGVSVEDGVLVVQGEQGPRVHAFLTKRGATRIVLAR